MEDFLKQFKGKKIDVAFGASASVRGEVSDVKDGILHLTDEDKRKVYVAIERIAVICEADDQQSRPGFVG